MLDGHKRGLKMSIATNNEYQPGSIIEVDPAQIKIGWRARKDYGDINGLAESIKESGQIQPITVKLLKDGSLAIVAGMRRLKACRKLKRQVKAYITSDKKDELSSLVMQLAENLRRKDFDRLELGEGLKRYKAIYEEQNPSTKHGAGLKKGQAADAADKAREAVADKTDRFTNVAAGMLGVSSRVIYDLLEIAGLPETHKATVKNAATTRERNVAANDLVRKVRNTRKEEKLKEVAKKKAEERAKEQGSTQPLINIKNITAEKLFSEFKSGSVDLILTDPPYELKRSPITFANRKSINKDKAEWDKLNVGWVLQAAPLLAKGGQMIVFCPFEAVGEYVAAFKEAKLDYRGVFVWTKSNPGVAARNVYVSSCECVVWATKGENYYFSTFNNAGGPEAYNRAEGPICQGNERLDHPAQKPLWLINRLLARHSDTSSLVMDPFVGVGTTAVACKAAGISCVCCEKDKKFFELAKTRIEAV